MRIDQARHDQAARRVDHRVGAVGREVGADRGDGVALDKNVGDGRLMHIAVVIVDLPAADQSSFRRHSHPPCQATMLSEEARALQAVEHASGAWRSGRPALK